MAKRRNPKRTHYVVPDETVREILRAVGFKGDVDDVEVVVNDGKTGGLMPGGWGTTFLVNLDGLGVVDLVGAACRGDDQAYKALNQGIVMRPGIVVVRLSSTGGETFTNPRIIVHPDDFAHTMLPSPSTVVVTFSEAVALVIAKSIIPGYDVQFEHWGWDMKNTGQPRSQKLFEEVYESLFAKGLVNGYGVLTTAGKNLVRSWSTRSLGPGLQDLCQMYGKEIKVQWT